MPFRLPTSSDRLSIIGQTGTGKTVAGGWHLSNANFDEMPWIIYDFKRDKLIAEIGSIDGVEYITTRYVPTKPGIFIVQPHPDAIDEVQAQLMKVWELRNTGIFIDEGYMVGGLPNRRSAFRLILTQGRSLNIPVIVLSQRPVWMDRFVFSESGYFQVFDLNTKSDRAKIMEYVPYDISQPLPEYHSYWYDVRARETMVLKPVPNEAQVLETIDRKMEPLRKRSQRVMI